MTTRITKAARQRAYKQRTEACRQQKITNIDRNIIAEYRNVGVDRVPPVHILLSSYGITSTQETMRILDKMKVRASHGTK